MGILNITPDSFYDGGKYSHATQILDHVNVMMNEGATIIDIGAMSSRPGAEMIPEAEEIDRLKFALDAFVDKTEKTPIISIDTLRSGVVHALKDYPIAIINDISGGNYDPEMYNICASNNYAYILMHMQGLPQDMQTNPSYTNVTFEVIQALKNKSRKAAQAGIKDIILDVGFGFGKTITHNYQLLKNLESLRFLGLPILAGVSRKSMIYKVLGNTPSEALNGTSALHMAALLKGANLLRVHDVKQAQEVILLYQALSNA